MKMPRRDRMMEKIGITIIIIWAVYMITATIWGMDKYRKS